MNTHYWSLADNKSTYHDNGDVTYWDVYRQQWRTNLASEISDDILASLDGDERDRIRDHERRVISSKN